MKKLSVALLLTALLWTAPAFAQSTTYPVPTGYSYSQQNPSPPSTTPLAVTSTGSAQASISASYPLVQVQNPTTSPACVALGGSAVSTPSPCPVQNQIAIGQVVVLPNPSGLAATMVAGILLNSGATGTLQISEGNLAPISSSSLVGTVMANQGTPNSAPNAWPTKTGSYVPLGCQVLPSMVSATGFTSVPSGATLADIQVAGQNVNYRDDGTAPTASVGLTLYAGAPFYPYSGSLSAIQFIQQAATATGQVCFYK